MDYNETAKTTICWRCGSKGNCCGRQESPEEIALRTTITTLEGEVERLEMNVCDSCLEYEDDGTPQTTYGWNENRVEGQHACGCIQESGPYQVLEAELKEAREEVERLKKSDERAHTLIHSYADDLEKAESRVKELDKELYLETVKNNSDKARVEFLEGKLERYSEALEKIASDDNECLMEYFEVGKTAPSLPRIYEDIACKVLIDTDKEEA